ncbi:hypothetical protein ETD83_23825 [Actinomadura soli]|uniref:Uncharacterized protein n=1 Tax=Actinomadura soli TaxID=2508997 RepID=A0A5C4J7Q7_9ACTN|nr:hypothetical protein [Actinomadura soli]TMQ94549.1 hypothetical protein ETD83_23825 [Actinomadura soli]
MDSTSVAFDSRAVRASLRTRLALWWRVPADRLLMGMMLTLVLGTAFWAGVAMRRVEDGAPGIDAEVSAAASHRLIELTPIVVATALLLALLPWGIAWYLTCGIGGFGWLGFAMPDLPAPPEPLTLPVSARDEMSAVFGWDSWPDVLKSVGLMLFVLYAARKTIADMRWRFYSLRGQSLRSHESESAGPLGLGRLFSDPFRWRTPLWAAHAAPLVLLVEACLLWSLLIVRAGLDGSETIDRHSMDLVASGFTACSLILVFYIALPFGRPEWNLRDFFRLTLVLIVGVALFGRPDDMRRGGPPWLGDLAADVTSRLLGVSCWAGVIGVVASFAAIRVTRWVYGWR